MKKNNMLVHKNKFKSLNELFNIESNFHIIAGPCSVESIEQMENTAKL